MTSLDVAPATSSTRTPVPIKERKSLWKGGTVEIKIPDQCREGSFESVTFIQFTRQVKKGLVNLFVVADNPAQYIGKTIVAEVEVMHKEMADGRKFVYVDLRPAAGKATHQLFVSFAPVITKQPVVFRAPTLGGEVAVFLDISGDRQLDRLLASGWTIQHHNDKEVYLTKGERSLTHIRPKQKKGRGK